MGLEEEARFSLVHGPKETCAPAAPVYATGQGGVAPSGQGGCSSAREYAAPQVLRCRPACVPACQAGDPRRLGSAEMTPAIAGGEEAPPAPEVKETSAIGAPTGGLLLPTPSGN